VSGGGSQTHATLTLPCTTYTQHCRCHAQHIRNTDAAMHNIYATLALPCTTYMHQSLVISFNTPQALPLPGLIHHRQQLAFIKHQHPLPISPLTQYVHVHYAPSYKTGPHKAQQAAAAAAASTPRSCCMADADARRQYKPHPSHPSHTRNSLIGRSQIWDQLVDLGSQISCV